MNAIGKTLTNNAHELLADMGHGAGQDSLVVLRRVGSSPANKVFITDVDGNPSKAASANATQYLGLQVALPDQTAMVRVLETVGRDPQACLVLGRFKDAPEGRFHVLSRALMEKQGGNPLGWTILEADGKPAICRSKDNMEPSSWLLIDRDFTDCQPEELTFHDTEVWWDAMCRIAPGLKGAGRIDLPSSSSRLLDEDGKPVFDSPSSHHYVQLADAEDMRRLGAALLTQAMLKGLGWRRVWGKTPSRSWSIYDPTTFSWERLSFDGAPTTKVAGTSIAPPDVRVGVEGGAFDSSTVPLPSGDERVTLEKDYDLTISRRGNSKVHVLEDTSAMRLDTQITVQVGGREKTLSVGDAWFELIERDGKLRAQTPFRPSGSWAALMRLDTSGLPFVYDVGPHTLFRLASQDRAGPPLEEFFKRLAAAKDAKPWFKATAAAIGRRRAYLGEDCEDAVQLLVDASDSKLPGTKPDRKKAIVKWIEAAGGRAEDDVIRTTSGLPRMEDALADFNEDHAVTMFGAKAVVLRERQNEIGNWAPEFLAPSEVRAFMGNVLALKRVGKKLVPKPVFPEWMQWPKRNTYDRVVFRPDVSFRTGPRPLPQGDVYNAWQGYLIEPSQTLEGAAALAVVLEHINAVFCDGDAVKFEYLLDWFAAVIQHPERTNLPVPVLKSKEGVGKGIVVDNLLLAIFGVHGYVVTKHEDFAGRFNGHMGLNCFCSLNEALWGGNKTEKGQYKALLSDQFRSVEYKFRDAVQVPNFTKAIISSNEDWFAHVGLSDRRHVVFDCVDTFKDDVEYFKKLGRAVEAAKGEFLHMMLQRQVEYDAMRKPPRWRSEAAETALFKSADSVEAWLHGFLQTGESVTSVRQDYDTSLNAAEMASDMNRRVLALGDDPATFEKNVVYDAYATWAKDHRRWSIETYDQFCKKMRKLLPEGAVRFHREGVKTDGSRRKQLVTFAPLGDVRDAFSSYISQPITWSDTDE